MDRIYVTTKYFGATNHRGSRIRVDSHHNGRVTLPYDYSGDAHAIAVAQAVRGWGYSPLDVRQLCPSESGNGSVWEVTL